MVISLIFSSVFLVSGYLLWSLLSQKIPQLVAIPDQVITERLHEDSAKLRLFLLHFKTFYREKKYQHYLWRHLGKVLYRLHLILLKVDNGVATLLKSIRARGIMISGVQEIAKEVEQKIEQHPVTPRIYTRARAQYRIQEVRQKTIKPE